MLNGLDYSAGMPDIAAMKQGNVAFVCRYVGWSDLSQTKILTPAEAQTLSQNGIAIVSNYEWYITRPQEGAAAADVDAARALQIHKNCGGPDNAPIYFSVDYNSPGPDVAEYFKELANRIGLQRVGAYGPYTVIKYLFDNHLITWGWQTYSESNGQWDNRAQIRQTQFSVQFGGIDVDFDTGMVDNVGQWKVGGVTKPVILNDKECVCDIPFWFQLSEGEMELCGPASVEALRGAGFPGKGPRVSPEQVDQWVDAEVAAMGFADPKNFPGVSIPDMERILHDAGLHYFEISSDWPSIRAAVRAGYPVIITGFEPNIFAWDFNSNSWVPAYSWGPSTPANHVFPVGGFDQNGNPICMDQMNNSYQGYWPPIYDAGRLHPTYACVVQLPWLVTIPSGTPLTWPAGFNAQLGGSGMPVPSGWKDDGTTLTAPNGFKAVHGFRLRVVNDSAWDPGDYLLQDEEQRAVLEESNTSLGGGARQITRKHSLEYTTSRGVFDGYIGQELLFVKADRDAKAAALAAASAQIAQLQAQLAQAGTGAPSNLADIKAKMDKLAVDTSAAAQTLAGELAAAEAELSSDLPPKQ